MGQTISATRFYLYGRSHFTRNGYSQDAAVKAALDNANLDGKIFICTGSNSGIGKELVRFLYKKGAHVFMFCRSVEKANECRTQIESECDGGTIEVIQCDCGIKSSVEVAFKEFETKSDRLDGLICNAGALSNKKVMVQGYECTMATHLIFGTYLLGKLAIPLLNKTDGSRMVMVSSGGMYTVNFPTWDQATWKKEDISYSGNLAYAYAKRGQVLLAEQWADKYRKIKIVSCHPGWVDTPGVEAAYGKWGSYLLSPLRSLWEGTEGIAYLCACPAENLKSGSFYLDGRVQKKHLNESSKNTLEQVEIMMNHLEECTLS